MSEKIRLATKKDIPIILNLLNSDPNLRGRKEKYEKKDILEYITNPNIELFVYEINKKIVGSIRAEIFAKAKYIRIWGVIVDKKHRKKSIGRKLMHHIKNKAKKLKINSLFLFTEINNKRMQKLLKKEKYERGKKFFFYSKKLK